MLLVLGKSGVDCGFVLVVMNDSREVLYSDDGFFFYPAMSL